MQEYDYASFQDRMQDGRDAAAASVERLAYLGATVTRKRASLRLFVSVADVAALWGVTETQVKAVLGRGGIPGAYRRRKGRGRPWAIPAVRLGTSGSGSRRFHVECRRGERGVDAQYFTGGDSRVPI